MQENLTHAFADGYMEKLFYFCLKKTGSREEAEDLTQDIALQVVTALNKGTVPEHFSAWVWQIARNRYSLWAAEKRKKAHALVNSDVGDMELADENEDVTDELIQAEQMALLRRELAFIRSDYRNIVVAYYIENKSLKEIAFDLALTESAVQQRLHRARILLKEGMEMAREFGRMSYKPENVSFIFNGCHGENKEPLNHISRSLCKNILLAAYRTPSTAKELAMEVGVALPYMEEELSALVADTLMKKNGDKYETGFFIVSARAQQNIREHLSHLAKELTEAILKAVEFEWQWKNEHNPKWQEGYQCDEDMKWGLLLSETDRVSAETLKPYNKNISEVAGIGRWGHTLRPNGGEWDLIGLEQYPENNRSYISLTGCVGSPLEKDLPEILFRHFFIDEPFTDQLINYAHGQGLVSVANGKEEEVDGSILNRLESIGYIKKEGNRYVPNLLVIRNSESKPLSEEAQATFDTLRKQAVEIAAKHYIYCREQIYKEIPDALKVDTFQIDQACVCMFSLREAVLKEAINTGYLSYDRVHDRRTIGASLTI